MENNYFGAVDFLLFGGLLLMSVLIGIYSACKGKKVQSTEDYYFGNRNMTPIPVGLSLGVSFVSAVTIISAPAESYLFGAVLSYASLGALGGVLFTSVYFVPLVYRLSLSSVYEYLEMRFDRGLRVFCSAVTILQMVLYMGICVYVPALALNAVTPLDIKWTIILTSLVCTFYTSLGGFKAVVWTDTLQAVIMMIGSLALCIQGTILVGGSSKVWNAAIRGGRLNMSWISFDPTVRLSALHCIVGQTFMSASMMCSNQAMAQRIMSCKSARNARKVLLVSFFPTSFVLLLAVANGIVMYAYYENCDPLLSHQVEKADQMIPNMMTEAFLKVPGMAGIFVAAACSGTLSTVSSGINSLSVIVTEDFVAVLKKDMTSRQKLWGGKLCGAVIGCLVTVIAFVAGNFGTTLVQIAASLIGGLGGPIFGAFLSGIFIPRITAKGALTGVTVSAALNIWIIVGAAIYGTNPAKMGILSRSVSNCSHNDVLVGDWNASTTSAPSFFQNYTTETNVIHAPRPYIADTLYSISYNYVSLLGIFTSIVAGFIVSLVTGSNDPKDVDPVLFVPMVDNKRLPEKIRKVFRFGVPEMKTILDGTDGYERVSMKKVDSRQDMDTLE